MTIIDAHCHVYPEKIALKAVEAIGSFYGIPVRCPGTPGGLAEEHGKAGISHAVIHSVATAPQQVRSINRFIAAAMKENPDRFTGLGTLHPRAEDVRADIEDLIALGLHGVKLHPDFQRFRLDDPVCETMFSICQEMDLPVLIHTGDPRYDFSNPDRLVPVLKRFSRLRVIGAHFGGWSLWEEAAEKLSGFAQMCVDTSSSLYAMTPEAGTRLVRIWGAERCIFGTDYPMWDTAEELKRFHEMKLTAAEEEQILWKTAARVYRIALPEL